MRQQNSDPLDHGFTEDHVRYLITLVGLFLVPAAASAQQPSPEGVWDIVELVNWSAEGVPSRPFGDDPLGYFVYTPGGNLILHITVNPRLPSQASPPSVEELAARARSSIAYFGTFSVDQAEGVITHEIVGDLSPNRAGTDQARPYRIEGDELVLDFSAPDGRRYLRRLRRVENLGS